MSKLKDIQIKRSSAGFDEIEGLDYELDIIIKQITEHLQSCLSEIRELKEKIKSLESQIND